MIEELKLIRNIFLRLLAEFGALTVGFLFLPVWHGEAVTSARIEAARGSLIPAGATLAVTNPLDPFLTQATIAASLALAILIPLACIEAWIFIAPALLPRERAVFGVGLLSALLLAASGAAFAYFVLVPLMVGELYAFLPGGVGAYFSLSSVVSLVTGFMVGCALMFLLPLVMALLTLMGLVPARVWREYARVAVLLVLVASAIITPDGSGVGMILLSAPVCALYGAGYAASAYAGRAGRQLSAIVN